MTSPCSTLTGRLRDICTGAAGIPAANRRRYLDRWIADGRLASDPDNAPDGEPVHGITPSQANPPPAPVQGGPGTELKAMLASIGIEPGPGCPCRSMMRKMDGWGVAGCREHRGEIVMHVQEQMANRSWREKLEATARATANGLAFHLDPRDIPGSLVDEAIRRAESLP